MEAAGGAPDDRTVARLARGADIASWVDAHWPAVTATGVVFRLLTDGDYLASCSREVLTDDERARLLWSPAPASPRQARWTDAEAFLVDEAIGVLQRSPSFGHVVVDEAQDLSAMQCRAIGRRCPTGSATVLGDLAQATAAGAVADWSRTLSLIGRSDARIVALTRGYRVPAEVLEFANRLLPSLRVQVAPAESLRSHPGSLRLRAAARTDAAVAAVVAELLDDVGSIAVIAADGDLAAARKALRAGGVDLDVVEHGIESRVTLVPVTLSKGLEFDHVVVVEPATIVASHARGPNWLYVALTRAVTTLTVIHALPLPDALADPAAA
jgi:DNA helicase IV